jgi:hypothetical protein
MPNPAYIHWIAGGYTSAAVCRSGHVTGSVVPSLSTSGETLTIEGSMNLEGENGERRTWRRARMELGQQSRLLARRSLFVGDELQLPAAGRRLFAAQGDSAVEDLGLEECLHQLVVGAVPQRLRFVADGSGVLDGV